MSWQLGDTRRLLYWTFGGVVIGALLSMVVAIAIALITYYPIGTYLPEHKIHSFFFAILGAMGTAGIFTLSGLTLAGLRWSWRPIGLAVAAIIGLAVGLFPASWAYESLLWRGYELLSARSAELIAAIENYEKVNGKPPKELAQLTPAFIASIPASGMPRSPQYEYSDVADYCSAGNQWELSIPAGDFIGFDGFFYCPLRDYSERYKIVGNWAYYFE